MLGRYNLAILLLLRHKQKFLILACLNDFMTYSALIFRVRGTYLCIRTLNLVYMFIRDSCKHVTLE